MIPDLAEVRALADQLHVAGQAWQGEAFGWAAEYNPEQPQPPLDSALTYTPADFCIGESGIWFFSRQWEDGRAAPPVEFLDDRDLQLLTPRRSLRGLWRGLASSADDITTARREAWANFPRPDLP